jgi:hypothetical protein
MDSGQADAVYELVVQSFADLGASDPKGISRSILLRNLCYAGQAFRCEGWSAVWLIDGDSIEFYDAAGKLVKAVSLAGETMRKAA